jgi:lysophospholipase L1-like esterase
MNMKILIFGDSITWGAWDTEGGWAQRIKAYADLKNMAALDDYYTAVYNVGISGDTSTGLLKRIQSEMIARLSHYDDVILVIVAIGTNDAQSNFDNSHTVTIENFQRNLQRIKEIVLEQNAQIVFVTPPTIDESRVNPIPWAPDFSYTLERIDEFSNAITNTAQQENCMAINLNDLLTVEDLADGVHPNTNGHEKIYKKILQVLIEKFNI